ncbi:MAG: hypothetical protein ACUZ77_11840 [Candidatus Brocadiales bacterium]
MKAKSFKVFSFQLSVFTPVALFSKNKILERIIGKYANIFDGDTTSIPIPTDAPEEFPRIILQSSDGKIKLEIAKSRVNLFRYRREDNEIIELKELLDIYLRIIEDYKDCTKAVMGRLAIVTVKYLEIKNPSMVLAKHFCKEERLEEPFNRPENFEIHSQKKYSLKEFNINSWVRCKTGNLSRNNINIPIVLVTQDINTLAEEVKNNDFNIVDLKKFAELVIEEQEEILNKYFHGE